MSERIPMIPPYRVISKVQILAETKDYNHKMMNVPLMWKETRGALANGDGVPVVVLDTGVPNHIDLEPAGGKSFISGYKEDRNGHGCVAPDTLVHTNFCGIETIERLYSRVPAGEQDWKSPDGTVSRVKDVRSMGMKTYALNEKTGETVIAPIEFLHRTAVDGEVVSVNLEGGISYRLTPWHEVCVLSHRHHDKYDVERKRADELEKGDRMIFASGPAAGSLVSEPYRVDGSPYRECANCGHIPNNYKPRTSRCQCKKCGKSHWLEKKRTHLVTEDLAYLAGIVLTGGYISVRNSNVEVSSETPEILSAVIETAGRLGFKGRIDTPADRCSRAIIGSKELVDVCLSMGLLAKDKTYRQELPEFVGKSPFSVVCSFLAGVIDGAGCISAKNTKNRITTVSPHLSVQLSALLNSIGISSGVQDYGVGNGFGITGKSNVLNVTFSGIIPEIASRLNHPEKRLRGSKELAHRRKARRISSVGRESWSGDFFDFTVQGHHTYLGNGHFVSNTHCGGIIAAISNNGMGCAGIAPDCADYYGAVLDARGSGEIPDIIKGIRWAVDEVGAKIISMSLGIPAGYPIFKELEDAVNYATEQGVAVICAAGNEAGGVGQPACFDASIAVAAVNNKKEHARFSNVGPEVDFAAGGVDVYSTYLNNGYARLSGTSMACPALAGVATLILADEKNDRDKWLSPSELVEKMKKIAYDVGDEGFDDVYGYGIPVFTQSSTLPEIPDEPEGQEEPEKPEPPAVKKNDFPCGMTWKILKSFAEGADRAAAAGASSDGAILAGLEAVGRYAKHASKDLHG